MGLQGVLLIYRRENKSSERWINLLKVTQPVCSTETSVNFFFLLIFFFFLRGWEHSPTDIDDLHNEM